MPLGVKQLEFSDGASLDFLDSDALHDAVRAITLFDGSHEGAVFNPTALPDTASVKAPFLTIRSSAVARALAASRPRYIGRVFSPPFDTLVVDRRGQQRKRKDFSISYLIGFRNAADRETFMATVEGVEGVIWTYENRRLDELNYTDDL